MEAELGPVQPQLVLSVVKFGGIFFVKFLQQLSIYYETKKMYLPGFCVKFDEEHTPLFIAGTL